MKCFVQKALVRMMGPALKNLALIPVVVVCVGTQVIAVQKMIQQSSSVKRTPV
jgi:xanthosine utilization system XapX-like protein